MPTFDIIKLKDLIRFGTKEERSMALLNVSEYINNAKELGFIPEVWELTRLKLQYDTILTPNQKSDCLNEWSDYLQQTEYPMLIKLGLILQYRIVKRKILKKIRNIKH